MWWELPDILEYEGPALTREMVRDANCIKDSRGQEKVARQASPAMLHEQLESAVSCNRHRHANYCDLSCDSLFYSIICVAADW